MSWNLTDYAFDPYELRAERIPSLATFTSPDIGRRKGGRQRRSSVLCQVDGCGAELINEKTYYKRYRICMFHCNLKSLVIDGRRQRFCQQCGRFHDIYEFEGSRKSCRKKLERHNRRRRTAPAKGGGTYWSSESDEEDRDDMEDPDFIKITNLKCGRSRSVPEESMDLSTSKDGNGPTKPNPRYTNEKQNDVVSMTSELPVTAIKIQMSSAPAKNSGAQSSSDADLTTRDGLPLNHAASAGEGTTSSRSSPVLDTATDHVAKNESMYKNILVPPRTTVWSPFEAGDPQRPHPAAPLIDAANVDDILDGLMLFPEDPIDDLIVQQLSGEQKSRELSELDGEDNWLNCLDFDCANPTTARPPPIIDAVPYASTSFFAQKSGSNPLSQPEAMTGMHAASSMVSMQTAPVVGYSAQDTMVRLSLKLFDCTPEILSPQVKAELTNLLKVSHNSLLAGTIRPGCVHLTIDARMSMSEAANAVQDKKSLVAAVEDILERNVLGVTAGKSMLVQLGDEMVVVKDQKVTAAVDIAKSSKCIPEISAVKPIAIVAGQNRTEVVLSGRRLNDPNALVMCRQGGRNLTVELPETDDTTRKVYQYGILGLKPGTAEIEVQIGSFLGPSKPIVVMPDTAAVKEVLQLQHDPHIAAGIPVDTFLRDLGLVAQYLDRENATAEGRALPPYDDNLLRRIEKLACNLVVVAVARKWTALTSYLLPATLASQSVAAAVNLMDAACPAGMTLFHVAVGTGNIQLIKVLATWVLSNTDSNSHPLSLSSQSIFSVNAKGTAGVTPLHAAACLPPKVCEAMKKELSFMCSVVDKLWGLAESDDGTTPESLFDVMNDDRSTADTTNMTDIVLQHQKYHHQQQPVMNKSNKLHEKMSNPAGSTPSLDPLLNWKSRQDAKLQFIHSHVSSMIDEVHALPKHRPSLTAWEVGITVVGSLLVLAVAASALALRSAAQ